MNIMSPIELSKFLSTNGIVGVCQEAQNLVACIGVLSRMCACDPPAAKQAKAAECTRHYVAFASKAGSFSALLMSKTADNRIIFYSNGQIIGGINR